MIRMLLPDSDSLFVVVTAAALGRCRWHIALGSVAFAALSDRSISCLPWYTATAVFPVRNCLRWAGERRRQRECEPTSCSVEGVRTEGKRRRKYAWNTVTARALVLRTNLQDTSGTNQAFIKDFGGWNQHSPVRSGTFPTRPSPRTPKSAVSEARSTFAAHPSSTRDDEQPRR